MGIFGKKVELSRDFFVSGLDLDKVALCNFRERKGFKITLSSDYNSNIVSAKIGSYIKFIEIVNRFYSNGKKECTFFFSEYDLKEVSSFLESNFRKVPKELKYISSYGPPKTISSFGPPAVFLDNGDIICQKHFYSSKSLLFEIVTEDKIYNK